MINYWFSFFSRYLYCLFLLEWAWKAVSFKELVHFILIIKAVGLELFTIFLDYPFNVHGTYSNVFLFISNISNLCFLFFSLGWLKEYWFYWSFQRINLCSFKCSVLIFCFQFHWFCSNFYYLCSSAYLAFNLLCFF